MAYFDNISEDGDLRSIGNANKITAQINDQHSFDELFKELYNKDRKIVMRAVDAIEKITIKHPAFLGKHTGAIIKFCGTAKAIELKWHLALLVSRLLLTEHELGIAWQTLTDWATNKKESRIVRVNSIQGLFDLLPQSPELTRDYELTLNEIKKENIPSINARIRKLTKAGN